MWKRDEREDEVRTPLINVNQAGVAAAAPAVPAQASQADAMSSQNGETAVVNIGKSVVIKGELNGSEDLTIEGQVEGRIELNEHVLTVGANGRIKADVFAKAVVVLGEVVGNVTASEKVDIRENGSVDGDIVAPRVAIAEGANFRGSVDMKSKGVRPASNARAIESKAELKVEQKGTQMPAVQPLQPVHATPSHRLGA